VKLWIGFGKAQFFFVIINAMTIGLAIGLLIA